LRYATTKGHILEISMQYSNAGMDVAWISDYNDESEILLLNKYIQNYY